MEVIKKQKRFMIIILISLIFLFFNVRNIGGVGISAPKVKDTIDFKPGFSKTYRFNIVTNAEKTMDYQIRVKGDLKDYVKTNPSLLKNVPPGEKPSFSATITLPEKLEPGMHKTLVCVLETEARGQGVFGARTEACAVILVKSLYPGKFIELQLKIPSANVNEIAKFEISVESWGTEDINNVYGIINIFSESGKKIKNVKTNTITLASNEKKILTALVDTSNMLPGIYNVSARVFYDEKNKTIEGKFSLGNLSIEIINYTKKFEKGKINKFEIEIQNLWNNPIKNVYSEIYIEKEKIKTPTIDLKAREKGKLVGYWEANVTIGKHNAEINIFYKNQKKTVEVEIEVLRRIPNLSLILITIILPFVIIAIVAILIILRKKENGNKKKNNKKRKK